MSNFDLPQDRLATTDEKGKRVFLYPASVTGKYKSRKTLVHAALMLFFLILPWVHVGGKQLLLLNVAKREFFFFGLHFRAHDAPLLVFFFLSFAFLIGFITAIWGRLWCGWACPQTVFIEFVYRRIEAWIEGSHRERKALDESTWTCEKITKKPLKWTAFTLVSLLVTHSFLAYFVGSKELLHMVTSPPSESWAAFLVIVFTTGIILLDFGWFREQFCVIMCPYGRFQSVLLDSHSTVVAYDTARGEPRRGTSGLTETGKSQGDCVNCYRCVQVCPTGIDIRRGLQMECIACTACIDACDEVMTKIKKPTGLIRYTTQKELGGEARKFVRGRSIAYVLLFSFAMAGLLISLGQKDFLDVVILRAKEVPYQVVETQTGKTVINHFRVDISNQLGKEVVLRLQLPEGVSEQGLELVMPMNPLRLEDSANRRADFFLKFPLTFLEKGSRKIFIELEFDSQKRSQEVTLVGPDA